MGKKLILSQEQLDKIVGENISKSGVYGEEGVNDDSPNTESNPGFPGITIIPDDMKNSKDKDGESDVDYRPLDADDITKFNAYPDSAAYLNQTRGSRYYPGAVVYEETYTKEDFEKKLLNEKDEFEKKQFWDGTKLTNGNAAKQELRRAKQSGNVEWAKQLGTVVQKERDKINKSKKIRSSVLNMPNQYRDNSGISGIFSDN